LTATGVAPGAAPAAAAIAVEGAAPTGVLEVQAVAASAPAPSKAIAEIRVRAVESRFCISASWAFTLEGGTNIGAISTLRHDGAKPTAIASFRTVEPTQCPRRAALSHVAATWRGRDF
jgi:hypothetical protein